MTMKQDRLIKFDNICLKMNECLHVLRSKLWSWCLTKTLKNPNWSDKNMISISRDFDPVKLYPLGSQWLLQTLKKHKRKKVLAEQHCYDLLIIPKTLKHSNLSSKKSTKGKKVFGKQHCYDLLQESTDCLEQKYSSYPFIRQLITNEPHNAL